MNCLDCKKMLTSKKAKRCWSCYKIHDKKQWSRLHTPNGSIKLYYKIPNMKYDVKRLKGQKFTPRKSSKIMHDDSSLKYVTSEIYTK